MLRKGHGGQYKAPTKEEGRKRKGKIREARSSLSILGLKDDCTIPCCKHFCQHSAMFFGIPRRQSTSKGMNRHLPTQLYANNGSTDVMCLADRHVREDAWY